MSICGEMPVANCTRHGTASSYSAFWITLYWTNEISQYTEANVWIHHNLVAM